MSRWVWVGPELRRARENAGRTQAELSYAMELPQAQISRWENDTQVPRPETIRALAEELGVPMESFFAIEREAA